MQKLKTVNLLGLDIINEFPDYLLLCLLESLAIELGAVFNVIVWERR